MNETVADQIEKIQKSEERLLQLHITLNQTDSKLKAIREGKSSLNNPGVKTDIVKWYEMYSSKKAFLEKKIKETEEYIQTIKNLEIRQ